MSFAEGDESTTIHELKSLKNVFVGPSILSTVSPNPTSQRSAMETDPGLITRLLVTTLKFLHSQLMDCQSLFQRKHTVEYIQNME